MTEVDFPRGGALPNKEKSKDAAKKKDKKDYKKEAQKEALPEGHENTTNENLFDGVWTAPITFDVMGEGVLGLGCVVEVCDTTVILETAESHRVMLPATEVGAYCLAEMKEGRMSLEDAFPLGHFVPFKVLPKEKELKKKSINKPQKHMESPHTARVTVVPAKVNSHLVASSLITGLAISAQIKSIEEKGILLDIGLSKMSAFLSSSALPHNFIPRIGLPLTVRIQNASNSRMVQVALAVEMEPLPDEHTEYLNNRMLMPGTVILAYPAHTKETGALVDLGNGLRAWLPRRSLPPRLKENIDSFVKPIRVVVLLCQQTSRLLAVSAHPDIVAVSRADRRTDFQGITVGDMVKCRVTYFGKSKVEFAIVEEEGEQSGNDKKPGLVTATAKFDFLEGGDPESRYAVGTEHMMRVTSVRMIDRAFQVANKKEILDRPMISYKDAKIGAKVNAVVKKHVPGGIVTSVFNTIRGFIPIRFLSDRPIANVEKKFPIGEKVLCRVLSSTPDYHSVRLTARKSQVKDVYDPIAEASEEVVGKNALGVVVCELPKGGVLVQFYNDVCGRLPSFECRKKKNLSVNDAIAVRVVQFDPETEHITLALAEESISSSAAVVVKSTPISTVQPGSTLEATVVNLEGCGAGKGKGEARVMVRVQGDFDAVIPVQYISDSLDSPFAEAVAEVLPVSTAKSHPLKIQMLGEQASVKRATSKRFLVDWASSHSIPTKFNDIKTGDLLAGVITQRVSELGYFVQVAGGAGLVARVPFTTIDEGSGGERALSIGQTVVGRVGHVCEEKKTFTISLEPSVSFPESATPLSLGLSLLRSTVEELQWLATIHALPLPGTEHYATVVQVVDEVCLMKLEDSSGKKAKTQIAAFARTPNFVDTVAKPGARIRVLVVDYAWPRGDVEVVVLEDKVEEMETKKGAIKKGKKKVKTTEKSSLFSSPRVVVARRDIIAVVHEEEGKERLSYLPVRLHPNQVIETTTKDLPSLGSTVELSEESAEELDGVQLRVRSDDAARVEKLKSMGAGVRVKRTRKTTESKEELEKEAIDESGQVVKKFGIYKGRVEGKVEEKNKKPAALKEDRSRLSIHIKLFGGYGKLHVSELPQRFLVDGKQPIEDFLKEFQYKNVHCLVVNMSKQLVNGHVRLVYELTLNESKLENVRKAKRTIDFRHKFQAGDLIPVFYADAGAKNQLIYEVNPRFRALLEVSASKKFVPPSVGEMQTGKVLTCNKQGHEISIAIVQNIALQPGGTCTARVTGYSSQPLKLKVVLANGQEGHLLPTAVSDDYTTSEAILRKRSKIGQVLDVRALVYNEGRGVWLVAFPQRGQKTKATHPLIQSSDSVKVDTEVAGFVHCLNAKKRQVEVEIAPNLTVILPWNDQTSILTLNNVVSVKVTSVEEHLIHGELVRVIQDKVIKEEPRKRRSSQTAEEKVEETPKKKRKQEKEIVEMEDPGFDWNSSQFTMDAMAEIAGILKEEVESVDDGPSDTTKKIKKEVKTKEPAKKRKKKDDMTAEEMEVEKEKALTKKEKKMMEGQEELSNEEDYARALKGDPNSADLWIRYMTHFMGKNDLTSARATAERALKTINYREDAELLSLWCAFINLEIAYGDSSTVQEVFRRSCESADDFKLHKHIAASLSANDKKEEADEMYEKMIKKFRAKSDEVWTLYADHLLSGGRAEEGRDILNKALQYVPNQRHVQLLTRFAAMEYAKGDMEKGRNLFETVLATYPKKTDVWSVYVDLTVKHGDVEQARQVLERATSLPLSVFKLRPFYKQWLQLEQKSGDEATINEVKVKAAMYLSSLNEKLED